MNRYHLEIIPGNQPPFDKIIEADDMSGNSDGFYRFSKRVEENDSVSYYQTTAYYPISRTIISKIERDIEP
jgi:hypothetical protein